MIWRDDEQESLELLKKNIGINLLGFEELFNRINTLRPTASYPPYNIEKIQNNKWCIVLAVAGFSITDLDISLEGMQLIVQGNRVEEQNKEYIYKGIANRSFKKSFLLAEGIEIESADLENGLLKIFIKKPENNISSIKIPINNKKNNLLT